MITNTRLVHAPAEAVWAVLADGRFYPSWVVGATRMRDVDVDWPAVGSKIHHSVGVWPALLDDETEVIECEPGLRLVLQARTRPAGEATVVMELASQGEETLVSMTEDVTRGPALLVPQPVRAVGVKWRNSESLRRLAFLAEADICEH